MLLQTASDVQYVYLESSQLQELQQGISLSAGLLAVCCLLLGALVIVEIHRG